MGYALVVAGLRRKRARMAGEIAHAERALAKMRRALDTLDATNTLCEPATNPELIPSARPTCVASISGMGNRPVFATTRSGRRTARS